MLKARERKFWDRVHDIDYYNIPLIEEEVNENQVSEFKNSRDTSLAFIIIFFILIIAAIYETIKSTEWIKNNIIISMLIAIFLMTGLILFTITYYKHK